MVHGPMNLDLKGWLDTKIAERSPNGQYLISIRKQMRILYLTSVSILILITLEARIPAEESNSTIRIPWVVDSIKGDGSAGTIRGTTPIINPKVECPPVSRRNGSHRETQ